MAVASPPGTSARSRPKPRPPAAGVAGLRPATGNRSHQPKIYVFGWPSFLGGADTKLAHLLPLLRRRFEITVVPNDAMRLQDRTWTQYLRRHGIRYTSHERLPRRLEGFALSLCNGRFFTDGIAERVKARGLRVVWSSEMMWHHPGELDAVKQGLVDKVLFVSELQRRALAEGYPGVPGAITGNYVDPAQFPFCDRRHSTFAIGRLSRADPVKYPEDFPVFYECLGLPDTRFRVMAWDQTLRDKYRWHRFDERWDLLEGEQESQVAFLHSLDLFVYPLGHNFRESWGRSTVEAMLTGAIPLVPPGHHLENLLVHGECGFVCHDVVEYQEHARRLCLDYPVRRRVSAECRRHAAHVLCNADAHLAAWSEVFQ